ncbi:carboxymuconolactone decarboxylase family protein [Staphylococcus sp. NRL 16/872]|uniref:carboxymuconolactone decarboxylase family protein n=1 Tax=Staphylococcus sp. NRL 16/872 TaxID=2930131 RepID=UPI001FB4C0E1|nr:MULTISPECIES: carboxymuconolactone decarboxylase family protein [unclassified Staphylococcus]MCJ1655310.1 carboxymuconolactone decarboxylase family protein [Staphylococcus sp. NRL 21/187]MCJ1661146.1 carboxymuconolactone decarboxylase family protein [Staphylococcus sp. NRL 18/288]MCJ1667039.1 carboxymuconolactone decarboxylase family protein [Staphylococcus sp. NRL 19/737]WEN69514.1 carboxymuconolactone decarboxylase family protein [Staphylococcus sp. NRL 16/872]
MPIINYTKVGNTPFQKLLGHQPELMSSWTQLSDLLENDGTLSKELKEEIRRMLAQKNGCQYCKAKGKPTGSLKDEKSTICIGFTEVFIKMGDQIPDNIIQVLKEGLTDQEIVELVAFITFTNAQQNFGAIMNLEPIE